LLWRIPDNVTPAAKLQQMPIKCDVINLQLTSRKQQGYTNGKILEQ